MTHLNAAVANAVPAVLAGILSDGLGLEGTASECLAAQPWPLGPHTRGEVLLVEGLITLRLGVLVEPPVADRILLALVGANEDSTFDDEDRRDAVAEIVNMLAGRLAAALRAEGFAMAISHPTGLPVPSSAPAGPSSTPGEAWQWVTSERLIVLNIAFEHRSK